MKCAALAALDGVSHFPVPLTRYEFWARFVFEGCSLRSHPSLIWSDPVKYR